MSPLIMKQVIAAEQARARAYAEECQRIQDAERALRAGLCPDCGGRVLKRWRWLEFLTTSKRYGCTACLARHVVHPQD